MIIIDFNFSGDDCWLNFNAALLIPQQMQVEDDACQESIVAFKRLMSVVRLVDAETTTPPPNPTKPILVLSE